MAGEQEHVPSIRTRIVHSMRGALWGLLDPIIYLGLLLCALLSISVAPFLGMEWTLRGLALAVVAVGLAIAHAVLGIQYIGGMANQIQRQYQQEIEKVAAEPQRRSAPAPPISSWRN